jgi:hypothetical protein
MDDEIWQGDVLPDDIRVDDAGCVFVLEEPALSTPQVRRMRSADDLEGVQLDGGVAQLRLIGNDLHPVGLEHRARQPQGEGLANPDRRAARAPPATDRIDLHQLPGRLLRPRLACTDQQQGCQHSMPHYAHSTSLKLED